MSLRTTLAVVAAFIAAWTAEPIVAATTTDSDQKWVNIPDEFTGLWSEECHSPGTILILSGYGVLNLEYDGDNASNVVVAGRFTSAEETNTGSYELGTDHDDRSIHVSLSERGLKVKRASAAIGNFVELERCPQLPSKLAAVHGEGINGLLQLDRAVAACELSSQANCAVSLLSVADVSGNSKLSVAELARMLRIVMYMGIVFGADSGASAEDISTPTLASLPLAPLILRPTVSSLDYDADGQLSMSEIVNDRADIKGFDFNSMRESLPSQSDVQSAADRLKSLLTIFTQ